MVASGNDQEERAVIRYGNQSITEDDINAVIAVLKSDFLTQGPTIKIFEDKFSEYVGSKYAVAVANGTAALHICNKVLGVKKGTRVITSPITFVATANATKFCGGDVYFADIDPNTYLLDPVKVEELINQYPKNYFSGIIPVDFAGRSVDMEAFKSIAEKHGLWIIEDACHAPGGYFIDSKEVEQKCGNGNYADLAIFSFHPVKHIACGEGGMVTTNDPKLYRDLLKYRSHGITSDPKLFKNNLDVAIGSQFEFQTEVYPLWYMEMQNLGFNYRITDLQCALGISQLSRAEKGVELRRKKAAVYQDFFKNKDYIIAQSGVIEGHAYHLYVVQVKDRLGLYNHLMENKIVSQIHYLPVHLMPYYQKNGKKVADFEHAEYYYSNCLSLPLYPTLTEEQQKYVLDQVDIYYQRK